MMNLTYVCEFFSVQLNFTFYIIDLLQVCLQQLWRYMEWTF